MNTEQPTVQPPEYPTIWPGHTDDNGNHLLAVDCEWHGRQHYDGQLRTIQFAWSESDAVIIEFRNENVDWSFELDGEQPADDRERYRRIGEILAPLLNRRDVKYIGHHFTADSLWMEHWLNLDVHQKCAMDTEFAQQTVDESSELDLERGIAMKYTTLGFYSQELIEWKRDNRKLVENGYGRIPSAILFPYAAYDVIAPYRAYPLIRRQLAGQQLTRYYDTLLNPFVSDVFHTFSYFGLPMDRKQMDELRELYHFARRRLEISLKRRIHDEAKVSVFRRILEELPQDVSYLVASQVVNAKSHDEALDVIKNYAPPTGISVWSKRITHMIESKDFNIRSPEMLRRWLFDVEGLMPIKSTNQKAKGLPSQSWEKVLELPPDRQKLFTPAVDKQTLQILSVQLPALDELLDLNAVGNICKAFLKEAEVFENYIEDDEGEMVLDGHVIKENGLHSWLTSEDSICGLPGAPTHSPLASRATRPPELEPRNRFQTAPNWHRRT